jgi:hypothetical protein
MGKPRYLAIFLTPASKRALLKEHPPVHEDVHAGHVTLVYEPSDDEIEAFEPGTLVKFRSSGYVADGKGQALTVELPAPFDGMSNRTPHVTISTATGVDPVYSNTLISKARRIGGRTYTGIVDWPKRLAPVRTRRFPMAALKTAAQWAKLRENDRVKVYHGTRLSQVFDLINGFDATKVQPRHYGGPRHRGVFVSPDFKLAKRFADRGELVLELEVRAKNLHGTDYSGNIGRGTGPHGPLGVTTLEWAAEKYPDSFRPYLSMTLLQSVEPQALLIGLVAPRQIKRVFYTPYGKTGKWYTRKAFLDLGLEVSPGGRARKEKVRDLGVDLSYPGLSYDRFVDAMVKVLDIRRPEVEKTLKWRSEISMKPGRSDVLEEMIEQVGFEPTAARAYADLVREHLAVKQVAARYVASSPSQTFTPEYVGDRTEPPRFLFHFTRTVEQAHSILQGGIQPSRGWVSLTENPAFTGPKGPVFVLDTRKLGRALSPHLYAGPSYSREAEWRTKTAIPMSAVVQVGWGQWLGERFPMEIERLDAAARGQGIDTEKDWTWTKWWPPKTSASRVAALHRRADLSPPLGYPGGTCHVVDRIDDADPKGEERLIDKAEAGLDLYNSEAARVYKKHVERGAWKYDRLVLGPHAQYRMDLRGITVPEVRAALKRFFRAWGDARSEGDSFWDEAVARNQPIDWIDKRQRLQVSFVLRGRNTIKVITVFRPGDPAPPATDC